MKSLVEESERVWLALGKVSYELTEAEKPSLQYKRSIYVSGDIKAGEVFTGNNLKVIRPANGLHPRYFEQIIGKKAKKDIASGTPLQADMVE